MEQDLAANSDEAATVPGSSMSYSSALCLDIADVITFNGSPSRKKEIENQPKPTKHGMNEEQHSQLGTVCASSEKMAWYVRHGSNKHKLRPPVLEQCMYVYVDVCECM